MHGYYICPLKEMLVVSRLAVTDSTISKLVVKTLTKKVSICEFEQVYWSNTMNL